MSAYLITDVEVTDEDLYAQFRERITPVIEAYGGRFVVRGGEIEVNEGDWMPKRLAIMEFDSMEQIRSFLASSEYKDLNDIRTRSSNINLVLVEGV